MITVAIPTAGRPEHLRLSLASVLDQVPAVEEVIVIDQSTDGETERVTRSFGSSSVRYLHRSVPGASAARNAAALAAVGDYVVFLDDDGEVPPGWASALCAELDRHDQPDALYGAIRAPERAVDPGGLAVSTFDVESPVTWTGVVHPNRLGYAGHVAIKRLSFERLGGFDVQLGPGTPRFGAEDMDINLRLLKAGMRAVTTPAVWMTHHQWRKPSDIPQLYYRYNLGHSAFCVKHLLAGDRYALRLVAIQVIGDLRMLASGVRRRSMLRVRTAFWRALGTWYGLLVGWRTYRR